MSVNAEPMTDITIPPKAWKAFCAALQNSEGNRAAIIAMLKAWPGMQHDDTHTKKVGYIILPLPHEARDE